jgi:hypothetical protein
MFKFSIALFLIAMCTVLFSIDTTVKEPIQRQDPFTGTAMAVPGVIQAEDYDEGGEQVAFGILPGKVSNSMAYRFEGVNILPSKDNGGGFHVGGMAKGEWLEYTISVPESGHYQVSARLASDVEGVFSLSIGGKDNLGPQGFLSTGQSWRTVNVPWVHLPAGTHVLRFTAEEGPLDLNWLSVTKAAQSPYGGTPFPCIGILQAENYDNGGQNVAYYDTTPGNICYYKAYRFQDVDVENSPHSGSTINVGWIAYGEWLEYTINVPYAGYYRINVTAATPTGGKFLIEFDRHQDTLVYLRDNGDDNQNYWTFWAGEFYLTQGQKIMRITMKQDLWNLDRFVMTPMPVSVTNTPGNDLEPSRKPLELERPEQ